MNKKKKLTLSLAPVAVIAMFTLTGCGVSNGNVGIEISPSGKVVSEKPIPAGFKITPINDIVEYPIKMVQVDYNKGKKEDKSIVVSTADGKRVNIEAKLAYHTEANEVLGIYKKFGNVTQEDMENGWLRTQAQNALREEYVKHSILDILTGRAGTLESDILKNLKSRYEKEGYVLDDVTLGVPDVDAETQKTIDSIISATQANEKAKKDAETALTNAKKDADVSKTKADAELYAKKKEAEGNAVIEKSVNDDLIKYKEAEARLKHGWVTVQGANGTIVDGK